MTEPLRITSRVTIPENELNWNFSRSGGAGGQHVNTSSTRVELSFDLLNSIAISTTLKTRALQRLEKQLVNGRITVIASERRSQFQNRLIATERLIEILQSALAPPAPKRRATRPTISSKTKRLDGKRKRGNIKRSRQQSSDDD